MKKAIDFAKEFGVSIVSLALPLMASAQAATPQLPVGGSNTPDIAITSATGIMDTLCVAFGWAFYLLIVLSVIFIIVAAYKFLSSSGNAEKVKEARNTILYAAIAVGVALLARAIPAIVASFLGATGVSLMAC